MIRLKTFGPLTRRVVRPLPQATDLANKVVSVVTFATAVLGGTFLGIAVGIPWAIAVGAVVLCALLLRAAWSLQRELEGRDPTELGQMCLDCHVEIDRLLALDADRYMIRKAKRRAKRCAL